MDSPSESNVRSKVNFIRVCCKADVPPNSGKAFDVNGRSIAVFHTDDGFFATAQYCSHALESLAEGWLEGNQIECPRHGAMFDLKTGEAMTLPATEPIAVYPVELRGEDVYVGFPEN